MICKKGALGGENFIEDDFDSYVIFMHSCRQYKEHPRDSAIET